MKRIAIAYLAAEGTTFPGGMGADASRHDWSVVTTSCPSLAAANEWLLVQDAEWVAVLNQGDAYTVARWGVPLVLSDEALITNIEWKRESSSGEAMSPGHPVRQQWDRWEFRITQTPSVSHWLAEGAGVGVLGNLWVRAETFRRLGGFNCDALDPAGDLLARLSPEAEARFESRVGVHAVTSNFVRSRTTEAFAQEVKNPWSWNSQWWPISTGFQKVSNPHGPGEDQARGRLAEPDNFKRSVTTTSEDWTFVIHESSPTGAPVAALKVIERLRSQGEGVRVLSLRKGSSAGAWQEKLAPKWLGEWRSHKNAALRQLALFGLWLWVRWHVRGRVVLNSVASFAVWPALLFYKKQIRIWIHECANPYGQTGGTLGRWVLYKVAPQLRAKWIFAGRRAQQYWARFQFHGVVRYLNFERSAKVGSADSGRILAVGSLAPLKGYHFLLHAVARLRSRGEWPPGWKVVGLGWEMRTPYQMDFAHQMKKLGVEDLFEIHAPVPTAQVASYYQAASVFVHPSVNECLPLAVVEAMAHGLGVVAADSEGCSELIEDGQSGWLVRRRDEAALAHALLEAMSGAEERRARGERARATVQHLMPESRLQELIAELH